MVVSQRSASRRALAERLGVVAVDPASEDLAKVVHEVTGGRGVDVTFICIGVPTLVDEAMQLTRIGGRVDIFAGMAGAGRAEISANLLHYRQLTLTGSSDIRRIDYAAALELIESGASTLRRWSPTASGWPRSGRRCRRRRTARP